MAAGVAARAKTARETDHADEFEEAALLTLGLCYLDAPRFAGGAYHPFPEEGRPLQRQAAGDEPARARRLRARRCWDRRRGEEDAAATAEARLQLAVLRTLRRRAHQPGALSTAPKRRRARRR
jgi:hypothetical protein